MCKAKTYTEQINEFNEFIAFRIDFFSVPSFKNEFVEIIGNIIGPAPFQERLLTEEEKQKIDIDSIVNNLDNSIEEIISKKIYKFYDFKISNISAELYISQYYLFLYLNYKGDSSCENNYLLKVSEIFNTLKPFSTKLTPQKISLISTYHALIEEKLLWNVFDKEAFPLMESNNLVNGRYADQHLYKSMSINLIREIRKGYYEVDGNEKMMVDVNITSYATSDMDTINDTDFQKEFQNMQNKSQSEVTRCFNDEFNKK